MCRDKGRHVMALMTQGMMGNCLGFLLCFIHPKLGAEKKNGNPEMSTRSDKQKKPQLLPALPPKDQDRGKRII